MSFNLSQFTLRGKLTIAGIIIVCIALALLLLLCPPRAEATKSTVFELKEPGEPYDGKIKTVRYPDNTYVIYTDGYTILIKDGNVDVPGTIDGKGKLGPQALLVDHAGTGDFTTIQSAIDSISDSGPTKPYVLYVMPGVYEEQVIINNKSFISIVGIQPSGAKITEAQNSGVIIKHQSSGVGSDLMTFWIWGGGSNDLKGITLANLTILNTQASGVGIEQAALDIGRGDSYPRSHEILIQNCNLYGEQDTVFVNTGNPIFVDCYIEGDLDIFSIADDTTIRSCLVHSHTGGKLLWLGKSGDTAFSVNIFNTTFSKALSGFWFIGIFSYNNPTLNLYNCTLLPNAANGTNWDWNGKSATLNIFATNGENWGTGATYIKYDTIRSKRDAFFEGGLNLGPSITGAGSGQAKISDGTGTLLIKDNELATDQDFTLDMLDAATDRTFYILNSDGTKKANLNVEKSISWHGGTVGYGQMTIGGNTFTIRGNSAAAINFSFANLGAGTANLNADGYVHPDGGYKSSDGSPGINSTIEIRDYYGDSHFFTFKNGLLVTYTAD